MSESQINTLLFVALVRKYAIDESQVIVIRNKCIKMIMGTFECGYARACQLFSEAQVKGEQNVK